VAEDIVALRPPETQVDPPAEGFHNATIEASRERILRGASYRDCSTVGLLPVRESGTLHWKVSVALKSLMVPMNQKFHLQYLEGMEVADAYNAGLRMIFQNPDLKKWRFVLTVEHDNTPPPDALIKAVETMYSGPWAAVAGLYWTKGEGGMPMIYGDPLDPIPNFRPLAPKPDQVQECRGVAMGFTLWDRELFEDKRLWLNGATRVEDATWFQTLGEFVPGVGARAGTQDLEFCGRAGGFGYRFCVDNRIRVGHVQLEASPTHPAGFVW